MSLRLRVLICWYAFLSFFDHVNIDHIFQYLNLLEFNQAKILILEFVGVHLSLIIALREYSPGENTFGTFNNYLQT